MEVHTLGMKKKSFLQCFIDDSLNVKDTKKKKTEERMEFKKRPNNKHWSVLPDQWPLSEEMDRLLHFKRPD